MLTTVGIEKAIEMFEGGASEAAIAEWACINPRRSESFCRGALPWADRVLVTRGGARRRAGGGGTSAQKWPGANWG